MNLQKLRILAIGDLHFKESNIGDMDDLSNKLVKLVIDLKPDLTVLLGDSLERHANINVFPLADSVKLFSKLLGVTPFFLLIGNHDRPNNSDFLSDYHPYTAMEKWPDINLKDRTGCKIISKTCEFTFGKFKMLFVPYVPKGRLNDAIKIVQPDEDKIKDYDIVFSHQELRGVKMGKITSKNGDIWPGDYPLMIAGHIHDYDKVGPNIIYTGTPIQHRFDETSDKSVSMITYISKKEWTEERIHVPVIERITQVVEYSQISTWTPPKDKKIKLIIRGTIEELKAADNSSQVVEFRKAGIMVSLDAIPGNKITNTSTNPNSVKTSYFDLLKIAVQDNPVQLKWLDKIFNAH